MFMGRNSKKKRVRDAGSEDDAFYGDEPLPNMSKTPDAPRNEVQGRIDKTSTELPPDLHDCVKAALLGHFGHEGAAGAGPLQVLQERVAPARIVDALFEQRCADLGLSSSQMQLRAAGSAPAYLCVLGLVFDSQV